jgi:hypothetical protein
MKRAYLRLLLLLIGCLFVMPSGYSASRPRFDERGNLIIVDRYNNRVLEMEPITGAIVWEYTASSRKSETNWLVGPRDAERFKGKTLIVAGGLPAGVSSNYPDGYVDNRVFEVNKQGKIRWQYGQTGVTGAGDNELNDPAAAMLLPRNKVLIVDRGNHRVIVLHRRGKGAKMLWQYGTTGVSGSGSNQLNAPSSVQRLSSGNCLIADTGNNRVIEVNHQNKVVWQFGNPDDTTILNGPTYACKIHQGEQTLITDSGNNRIIVVDKSGSNFFTYVTSTRPGSVSDPMPSHCVQLKNHHFLIADQFNQQVIEVDETGVVVAVYGTIGVSGSGDGLFNGPVDAKVVDDFTGLTPPKSSGSGGYSYSFSYW